MVKHFIDLSDFKKKELREILNFAKKIKKNPIKYSNLLKFKSLAMIFEKQSTRTRLSFAIGVKKLGGDFIEINKNDVGFGTRESNSDLIKVFSQYTDGLVIRSKQHSTIQELANLNIMPIINGLSDFSHPCQIISDIFTIEEKLGTINNKNISWVGDINNVLISLMQASIVLNFKLNVATPKKILDKNIKLIKKYNSKKINFFNDPIKAVQNTDCIMTDIWVSMGEKETSKKKKILKPFQVNKNLMMNAKKSAIFMHCLPAHRNEEVTDSVIDGHNSIVWLQARNRMFVQQSILKYCLT